MSFDQSSTIKSLGTESKWFYLNINKIEKGPLDGGVANIWFGPYKWVWSLKYQLLHATTSYNSVGPNLLILA